MITRAKRTLDLGRLPALNPLVIALVLVVALPVVGIGSLMARAQESTPAAQAACATGTPGAGGNATAAAASSPAASSGALCVTITMRDIYYTPNLVTIPADKDVTVELHNEGVTMHNFSVTDHKNSGVKNLNISVDVDPGATKTVKINAPEGNYYFFCNVPGHEAAGMFGYIDVKKDAKIASKSATVTPPAG
jgi:uncharacterized cupredoxin-like copper-binding protein